MHLIDIGANLTHDSFDRAAAISGGGTPGARRRALRHAIATFVIGDP